MRPPHLLPTAPQRRTARLGPARCPGARMRGQVVGGRKGQGGSLLRGGGLLKPGRPPSATHPALSPPWSGLAAAGTLPGHAPPRPSTLLREGPSPAGGHLCARRVGGRPSTPKRAKPKTGMEAGGRRGPALAARRTARRRRGGGEIRGAVYITRGAGSRRGGGAGSLAGAEPLAQLAAAAVGDGTAAPAHTGPQQQL